MQNEVRATNIDTARSENKINREQRNETKSICFFDRNPKMFSFPFPKLREKDERWRWANVVLFVVQLFG